MFFNQTAKVPYYQFSIMQNKHDVLHFCTTRYGGVSTGMCGQLNMDFTQNDIAENVVENRRRLAMSVGFAPDAYTCTEQTHSDTIVIVTKAMRGSGAYSNANRISSADALITNEPDICLVAKSADCVPILLYDPVCKVIATVHAGWRGTVKQIVRKTVDEMVRSFACVPENILAGIGPSIGPCCYEVNDDVENEVIKSFGSSNNFVVKQAHKSKKHVNLWSANHYLLLQTGLHEQNIETACLCTLCNNHEFFSWRHNGAFTGRSVVGIILQ